MAKSSGGRQGIKRRRRPAGCDSSREKGREGGKARPAGSRALGGGSVSRRSVPSRSLPSRSRAPKWRRRRAHRPAHAPRARLRGARRGRGGAAEGGGPGGGGRLRASVSSRAAGGQKSPRRNNWGPPCLCVCGGGGICVICVCERRQDGREGAPPASPARCRRSVPQVAPKCLPGPLR